MNRDIKVLLAHNNRILREGLLHMFRGEEGIRVVGEAEDAKELVRMVKELNPEVVIMESALSGIASSLGVSSKTIESHRRQIMERLNLSSVASLVKYAIREGLTFL